MDYCFKCGEKIDSNAIFCDMCGKPTRNAPVSAKTISEKQKGIIKSIMLAIVVVVGIALILYMLSNGSKLSGTWEYSDIQGSVGTYTFSGNSFTFILVNSSVYSHHYDYIERMRELTDELSDEVIDELAARIEASQVFANHKGTYSITNDLIKFIHEDGEIDVFSFSQTENTITIDGRQYIRK
jgi:hypothetical protein